MSILSEVMLKDDEDIFLDDMTLEILQEKLNVKIIVTDTTAHTFLDAILFNKSDEKIFKYNIDRQRNSYENCMNNLC